MIPPIILIVFILELKVKKVGCELIMIDASVEVECPDYQGNRLKDSYVRKSAKVGSNKKNYFDKAGPTYSSFADTLLN